jgi:hypothetical protein
MFNALFNKPKYFNKNLHEYCLKSTTESIRKKINVIDDENKINNDLIIFPKNNKLTYKLNTLIPIVFFLSFASILNYFFKTKK